MKRAIFLLILTIFLFGRENPFLPTKKGDIKPVQFKIAKFEIPQIKPFKWISFEIDKNIIKIFTRDKLKKVFTVDNPYKLVLDFRSKRGFLTKKIDIKNSYIKNIVIGSHKNYYRVAITLKQKYRYKIDKNRHITIKLLVD